MTEDQVLPTRSGFSGKQVILIVVGVIVITTGLTFWFVRTYVYASDFKPVVLSVKEQSKLDEKLHQLGVNPRELLPDAKRDDEFDRDGNLIPEQYTEEPEKRQITLSEKELNAMIGVNTDLAKRFAVDLSGNLASAKIIIPLDPDMPFLGGKTLRVNTGLELNYRDVKPMVILRGISVMGVPLPNAWLSNLKNVDLVDQFGGNPGFWQSFASGIEFIEITQGKLNIKLKE